MTSHLTLFLVLFLAISFNAVANAQQVEAVYAVDPYPPFVCQINVTNSNNKVTTQDIAGQDGNVFSFTSIKRFQSPYCTCLGFAFAQPNFQGQYSVLNLAGGSALINLKFVTQSYFLTCYPGISKTAFVKV